MEDDEERGVTKQETVVASQKQLPMVDYLPEDELNSRLRAAMTTFQYALDSPRTQMILRNSILILLELPEHTVNAQLIYKLLTDEQFRKEAIKRLSETTPHYWSEDWNSLWRKDIDPLLSIAQQRVAKRNSIITFWSKEWDEIPSDVKRHVVKMLEKIIAE